MTSGFHHKRVVELTDEFISNMEGAANWMAFWYDSKNRHIAVRKVGNKKPTVHLMVKDKHRTIASALGRSLPRYYTRPYDAPIADIMKDYQILWEQLEAMSPEQKSQEITPVDGGQYGSLLGVLMDAFAQATYGKGKERHNPDSLNFEEQDMMKIMKRRGIGFALGQADKKSWEGQRMKYQHRRTELLGAIIYIAGAIVFDDMRHAETEGVTRGNNEKGNTDASPAVVGPLETVLEEGVLEEGTEGRRKGGQKG